jgi:hypothetical protein
MKNILILSLLLCSIVANAQSPKYNLKAAFRSAILPASFSFVSGVAGGTRESILWRKDRFFQVFPKANRQYWDNTISWENKYTRPWYVPMQLTDSYHMLYAVHNIGLAGASITGTAHVSKNWKIKPLKHKVLDVLIQSACVSAAYFVGSEATFGLLFKRK